MKNKETIENLKGNLANQLKQKRCCIFKMTFSQICTSFLVRVCATELLDYLEEHVLIGLYTPNNKTLDVAYVRFGRHVIRATV